MTYESIDVLQRALAADVFKHSKDAKKAAGRALGTIVETITFFVLRSWNLAPSMAIEQRLPEYGNADITHNVEFSLHPLLKSREMPLAHGDAGNRVTISSLKKSIPAVKDFFGATPTKTVTLLDGKGVRRNCAVVARDEDANLFTAQIEPRGEVEVLRLQQLWRHPFAMVECKRVGVEEGQKKGPTTIEKAKQGAYVASRVSALQKVVDHEGRTLGVRFDATGSMQVGPYETALDNLVKEGSLSDLRGLVLTVGVVSNHGNWFTNSTLNKEMKVLRQSYDWLIFLTDHALANFISDTILSTNSEYGAIRQAFMSAYAEGRKGLNAFTKVTMHRDAFDAMTRYVDVQRDSIEGRWFEVLSEGRKHISELRDELQVLDRRVRQLHVARP